MATKYYCAIFNTEKHMIEVPEVYTDRKKWLDRCYQYDLECRCRSGIGEWMPYASTEKPFAWETVAPADAETALNSAIEADS